MGIILSVMLYGSMPFNDSNLTRLRSDQKARRTTQDPELTKTLSNECREIMYMCLTPDPLLRPDVEKIYNSKWLEKRALKQSNKQQISS